MPGNPFPRHREGSAESSEFTRRLFLGLSRRSEIPGASQHPRDPSTIPPPTVGPEAEIEHQNSLVSLSDSPSFFSILDLSIAGSHSLPPLSLILLPLWSDMMSPFLVLQLQDLVPGESRAQVLGVVRKSHRWLNSFPLFSHASSLNPKTPWNHPSLEVVPRASATSWEMTILRVSQTRSAPQRSARIPIPLSLSSFPCCALCPVPYP